MTQYKDDKDMSMGERIRLVRGAMTQSKFGLLISKHRQKVILYEAYVDTPSFSTMEKIAKIGNVAVDWLFHGTPTR